MEQENRHVREADGDEAQLRARVRALEAKLQQEKTDAVGRLASGVAHDLNNLLTPILAYGNMLMEDLPPGSPSRDFALEIVKAGDRLVSMTKTLQSLRVKAGNPTVVGASDVIASTLAALAAGLGADFRLETRIAPGLDVACETGQLEVMMDALVQNARLAMPAGGRLAVTLEAVADPAAHRLPAGDWVMLSVHDEGAGMTSEVREHMFEPYFSTRPKGQGKGLGLSLVYAAVRRVGGQLRALSDFGAGTDMQVFLRRANGIPDKVSES